MARGHQADAVYVRIDRRAAWPLQRQIADGLRAAIGVGRLAPGTRLPGTRSLAVALAVSRTTVALAIEALIVEGFAVARARSGVFVAEDPPRPPVSSEAPGGLGDAGGAPAGASALRLSRGARAALRTIAAHAATPRPVAFALARPALDAFPIEVWNRLMARRAARTTIAQLDYNAESPALQVAIAGLVSAARGMRVVPEQVLLVGGGQRAIELAAAAVLAPGDRVIVEDPGYPGARHGFAAAGADVLARPVDHEGLIVEGLPRARLVYVTPSCQYPLGVTMSLERRLALLAWAARARACVVEDDDDGELRFRGAPLPALAALDRDGRVLYVGSFSRTMFPAIRLGYLIAPLALVEAVRAVRAVRADPLPSLTQLALADFIAGGHYVHHVRRMRGVYRARRDELRSAAAAAGLVVRVADAGLHAICELPRGSDAGAICAAAGARGVEVVTLASFHARRRAAPGLVLGFGVASPRRIRVAMGILGEVVAARAG
ncbi:MAG: PLP-dependent aminotransferase family protein [Kofleriaceae bacterium]